MNGLYIHIPFCDKICTYCDFTKVFSDIMDKSIYLDSLFQEYELYLAQYGELSFDTIYFGGGTPSALNVEELEKLLQYFHPMIQTAKEITFEANPESLTKEKINILVQYGVNRVSMGVQTFDAKALKYLGRGHTMRDIQQAVSDLQQAQLANYNLDLIYALPNQTMANLKNDLEHIVNLKPMHISAYALIVEEHTKLYFDIEQHKTRETDEELQAQMYRVIQAYLADNGYVQYETSNWCKPTYFSQHNLQYWTGVDYLGVGLGSSGYINQRRYNNTKSISKYLELTNASILPIMEQQEVLPKQQMEEFMFLGLRLIDGISILQFQQKFDVPLMDVYGEVINKYLALGYLVQTGDKIALSMDAIFISNEILSDFIIEE